MSKTFNIYCDESCHLENDHKEYMVLGALSSPFNQVKRHIEQIKELKEGHHFYAEIKWQKVSKSQSLFYKDLVEYFFDTDLRFRAIVVQKSKIRNDDFDQDYDTFYYKMYYQLLNHKIDSRYKYNVYLDIKDTLSAYKVNKLKDILNTQYGVFNNVQNIRSHESLLLQLSDVITGALSYHLNDSEGRVLAKRKIIETIDHRSGQKLTKSSTYDEDKMNVFHIELR